MWLIEVIPFSRSIHKESLTYYSAENIPLGTIVSVPLRKKTVGAFVVDSKSLLEAKSEIKSKTFGLRKIKSIKGPSFLTPQFVAAAQKTSRYFASHLGQILNILIPSPFLKNYKDLATITKKDNSDERICSAHCHFGARCPKMTTVTERLVLQKSLPDRLDFYKTLVRSSFAAGHSIFICLPTINEIQFFAEELSRGIKDYVTTFHSELSAKKQIAEFNKVMKEKHPLLILATVPYLFIPRNDLKTIILEKEASSSYRTINQPFIDLRTFAEIFSEELKVKFILSDTLLRAETIWRHKEGELGEIMSPSFRVPEFSKTEIIDMSKDRDKTIKKEEFEVFSRKIKKMLRKTLEKDERMFLFVLRKGLASITVCGDCGTTLLCDNCNVPMVLYEKISTPGVGQLKGGNLRESRISHSHEKAKKRIFKCNRCREQKEAKTVCAECGSWNLIPLGIGADRVIEELKQEFSQSAKAPAVFQIDQEKVKNRRQAIRIINEFYKTPGSILVGTEMALFFLNEMVDNTAIISLDSLFSIPSFRIPEKIIQLLIKILSFTEKELLIQTRNPEEKILKHIKGGNLREFYLEELKERERFGYPPFKTLIKVTFAGNKRNTDQAVKMMQKDFADYNPEIFRAYIPRVKNRYITNMVIKFTPTTASGITQENWPPDAEARPGLASALLDKLYSLPPSFQIRIDPEDLL